MIELKNISVSYSGTRVVEGVSAKANAGEFIALVGPNGSGKSTLLKAIAGLLPYDGTSTLPENARDRAKRISYLAQDCAAPDARLVKDILALGRTPFLGLLSKFQPSDTDALKKASELCEIDDLLDRQFGSLSGGEKMRVHLGRTLATQAPILLADEPITALDPYYQISVMNILRTTAAQGTLVIAALHDLDLAKRYSDRVWVMQSGRLMMDDVPDKALGADTLKDVFRITPNGEIAS